jgi:flagellar biosynthetic protein FlhB
VASDDIEKQHPASAKQREKFASEGDIARSKDLAAALAFTGTVVLFSFYTQSTTRRMAQSMQSVMRQVADPVDVSLFYRMVKLYAQATAPFFITSILITLVLGFWQNGYTIPFKVPGLRVPFSGFIGRLIKVFTFKDSGVSLVLQVVKMLVLAYVCGQVMLRKIPASVQHVPASLRDGLRQAGDLLGTLVQRAAVVYLIIGALDYWFNLWRVEERMKMSSQQLKDEAKDAQGDSRVKGRMRSMHARLVQQRSMQEVPRADAIVVNPTHYAVAILYNDKEMDAPIVLAKGADLWAERIRKLGRHHGVPILSQPTLARALFAKVEPGKPIPEELYQAVALLLAHVYRIRNPTR